MRRSQFNHLLRLAVFAFAAASFFLSILVPYESEASFRGERRVTLEAAYTDNAFGATKGNEKHDAIFSAEPGLHIENTGGPSTLDFDASVRYDQYAAHDEISHDSENVFLNSNLIFEPNRFGVNLNGAYTMIADRPRENQSADNRVLKNNRRDQLIYSVSPVFYTRHGEWASTINRYTFSHSKDNPIGRNLGSQNRAESDSKTNSFDQLINSGHNFKRTRSEIHNQYSNTHRSNGQSDFIRKSSELFTEYAMKRHFFVTGRLGYEDFEGSGRNLSGTYWLLGGHFVGSKTDLQVETGRRYDDTRTWNGSLAYELTPRWKLIGNYSDVVQNEEAQRIDNLTSNSVGRGGVIDPVTGDTVDLTDSSFEDRDEVIRTKRLNLDLRGEKRRNIYVLGYSRSRITSTESNRDQDVSIYRARYERRLTPKANFRIGGSYTEDKDKTSDNQKNYRLFSGYDYRLGDQATVGVKYDFYYRDSSQQGRDEKENKITLTFQKIF